MIGFVVVWLATLPATPLSNHAPALVVLIGLRRPAAACTHSIAGHDPGRAEREALDALPILLGRVVVVEGSDPLGFVHEERFYELSAGRRLLSLDDHASLRVVPVAIGIAHLLLRRRGQQSPARELVHLEVRRLVRVHGPGCPLPAYDAGLRAGLELGVSALCSFG